MSIHLRPSVLPVLRRRSARGTLCMESGSASAWLHCQRRRQTSSTSPQSRPENTHSTPSAASQQQNDGSGQQSSAPKRGFRIPALTLFVGGFLWASYRQYSQSASDNSTSTPHPFIKYILSAKEPVSSTAAIFTFAPADPSKNSVDLDDPLLERAITSLEFKQPQLQIARSYTPLPEIPGQRLDELRFLIRRDGEVSKYLHRLEPGAATPVEMRGLYSEYMIPENIGSVVFLAAGTGIAPALRVASVLEGEARVHVLWANRRREECLGGVNSSADEARGWWLWRGFASKSHPHSRLPDAPPASDPNLVVQQVAQLQRRARNASSTTPLLIDYFVDEEAALITEKHVSAALKAAAAVAPETQGPSPPNTDAKESPKQNLLLISGPDGFIDYWAGPKVWAPNGKQSQGPLKGALGRWPGSALEGWTIVKL